MKRVLSLVLILVCILAFAVTASAEKETDLQTLVNETAKYMLSAVPKPELGSIGGEWAILGLARSGYAVPEGYFEEYYCRLIQNVQAVQGVLHKRKYTE